MLQNQYNFDPDQVTVTQVVANLGAMTGGTVVGYCSQSFGRRFSIIIACIGGAALLYPYGFTSSEAVIAPAFFEQFFVQGAWGVIPIHLSELAPASFRTFVVGTSYQLGNLVSSASTTIETTIGENYPLPDKIDPKTGKHIHRYKYGKVIAILMGAVYIYTIIVTILGPEHLGRKLDAGHDRDLDAVAHDQVEAVLGDGKHHHHAHEGDSEKGETVQQTEIKT